MRVTTVSGAVYEFRRTPFDYQEVRRVNESDVKRADGEWVRLVSMWPLFPEEGVSMLLEVESLAKYGPDDYGTTHPDLTSQRETTRVVTVEP